MPAAAQLASIPRVPRSSTTTESPSRAARRAMAHPMTPPATIATSAVHPAPLLAVIPQHFTRAPWRQMEEGAEEAGRLRALSVRPRRPRGPFPRLLRTAPVAEPEGSRERLRDRVRCARFSSVRTSGASTGAAD
jgi:hypothetical protein